jgi:transcriptional regulator with GAF, ATPase, and Fis domain
MPDELPLFDDDQTTHAQPPPAQYPTSALRPGVQARWSDGRGLHEVEIERRTVIGSASDSGIVVSDPAVSRIHAELDCRDDGLWLRDLGSRNGTFIDGVQVLVGRVPDGGSVRVGSTTIAVAYEKTPRPVELWPADRFGPLLGSSLPMRELFARLAKIARTDSTVLVQGETGTGKELVAAAIHESSSRAAKPFVIVDCGALPETLLEAELFGHTKGAFTGAAAARVGAIEAADGGTVFLDEVAELPIALQPKLLRVLESRAIRRVGETAYRKVNVRFVSATNRDVRTMVNEGAFREDLYFRLAVLPVLIPPLREHLEDVPLLMKSFVPPGTPLGPDVMGDAARRPWRGNVRELRNFVERVVALGDREALSLQSPATPAVTDASAPWSRVCDSLSAALDRPIREARSTWLDAMEQAYVARLLQRHGGNVALAAEAAGIDRTHIYRLIRKHER